MDPIPDVPDVPVLLEPVVADEDDELVPAPDPIEAFVSDQLSSEPDKQPVTVTLRLLPLVPVVLWSLLMLPLLLPLVVPCDDEEPVVL